MSARDRKNEILAAVVEEYTKTVEPVGSAYLAKNYDFGVSSATLRNEMMALEEGGYLAQPHTSAGRIPTEEGFRYYVNYLLENGKLDNSAVNFLKRFISKHALSDHASLKILAKNLIDFSDTAVILGFRRHDVFCTGLSRLFSQPELREWPVPARLGEVIDHIDEVMSNLYDDVPSDVQVWIGKENPFAPLCGTVMARLNIAESGQVLFGLLGPMRMNYGRNISLVKSLASLVSGATNQEL